MVNHYLNTSGMLAFRFPTVIVAVASTVRGYDVNVSLERAVLVHCTIATFTILSVG